jgi:Fe-S cluster biogenesis protein NfuA
MSTATPTTVDLTALEDAVERVCRLMRFHGGAIRLVGVSDDGDVEVRFEGMCQGCPIRPVTLYGTIMPAIAAVPGVSSVRARGVRLSEESALSLMTEVYRPARAALERAR